MASVTASAQAPAPPATPAPAAPDPRQATFDKLVEKIQRDPGTATPEEVTQVLQLGKDLGRPHPASMATKSYLGQHPSAPPALLLLAADVARLAGDLRTASTRYKQYLTTAPPSPEAARAADSLYTILIDFLGAGTEAFRLMEEFGEKFRITPAVKRYDGWFLGTAMGQKSYPAMARRLALLMSEQLPLEQERVCYWDTLDWFMTEISWPRPEMYPALPDCKKIVPLVRESPRRTARYNFFVANLAFRAGSAGKDPAALEKDFEAVAAAARAYLDVSPTATTMQEVLMTFSGGVGRWDGEWGRQTAQKRDVAFHGLRKLNDADLATLMTWNWVELNRQMITAEQFAALGAERPEFYKKNLAAAAQVPFVTQTNSPAFFKAQAAFLTGVPSTYAAAINSLAASDDLAVGYQQLIDQQSWFLSAQDLWNVAFQSMWSAYNAYPRDDAHKLPPDYISKLQVRFGAEYIAKSPLAFYYPDAARECVTTAWRQGGQTPADKSQVIAYLHLFDWMPLTEEQRKVIFSQSFEEFKRWAEEVRKSHADLTKAQADAAKAAEDGKKAREATTKSAADNQQEQATTKAAQDQAAKQLADAKQAHADATKAAADNQTALQAAQAAKDAAKSNELTTKQAEFTKKLADLAASIAAHEKTTQDLAAKAAQLTQAAAPLGTTGQQQDAALADATKRATEAETKLKELAPSIALIAPIEEAFKQVLNPAIADPAKGPNPLCQNIGKAVKAIQTKNLAQYLEAARALYPLVRDYDTKHTPFGSLIYGLIIANRLEAFDTFDFQMELLVDQLAAYNPQAGNRPCRELISAIFANRPGWSWQNCAATEKPRLTKMNDIIAKALTEQLAKKQFWQECFEWFRATRRGSGWLEQGLHTEVVEAMIEQKTLINVPWRAHPSYTCSYMWLIRNEFQPLDAKYPVGRYFDDMFVEECRQTKTVDNVFWQYSPDQQHKGYNVAAELFQDYAKLPFGYDDTDKIVYNHGSFWDVHSRLMYADDPIRAALLTKLESYWGKTRFDENAMGRLAVSVIPANTAASRQLFFEKLNLYVDRSLNSPTRVSAPFFGWLQLGAPQDLKPEELTALLRTFTDGMPWYWPGGWNTEGVAGFTHAGLLAQKRYPEMFRFAPYLWRVGRDTNNGQFWRDLGKYSSSLMEIGQNDLAATYGIVGLDIMGTVLYDDVRNALLAVRSKALSSIGAAIPVERADRRYPIFLAQASYQAGNTDSAWDLYLPSRDLVLQIYKDLDPTFSIWLVEKNTDVGNYDEAEELAKQLIQWVESAPQGFMTEARAHLLVAYAGIAFARQEYPRARAQFEQIALTKELEGTPSHRVAELKVAEVDRLTRHYDKATEGLEKLARRRDPYLQAEANYLLALIKYDQEQYQESRTYLDQIFAVQPNHPNARILEGKLYLRMKKLVEATEVKVGLASSQDTIVPGKALKVQLEDRNLAVVGQAANIEIRVWTDAGDEEVFNLLPFGDSKTKFEGQSPTALAEPHKGDHVLQVRGGDVVHYDYSDKFKAANKISQAAPLSIAVVSDADLYVSSGKILTREEQDQRALERLIRSRILLEEAAASGVALSTVRAEDEIKPGNKINTRVVDPDQSVQAGQNKVKVRALTSSGDRIDGFLLNETAPYSGVFEGQLPTTSAPATAFASDSEEGKEPNFAIAAGDYAPWVALADNRRPKIFSVDLNDNVPLGLMKVVADVPGRHLKRLVLQTSMNGKEFTNAGTWPAPLPAWDGSPRLELVRYANMTAAPAQLADFREYLDVGHAAAAAEKIITNLTTLAINYDGNVGGYAGPLGLAADGVNSWYIGHIQAAFVLPGRQVRTLRLDHKNRLNNLRYILTVDGHAGREPYEFSQSLAKGVHRVDIYFCAQRNASPVFELLCDVPQPPYLAACPAEMFDVTKHPEITPALRFQPAEIVADVELKPRQDATAQALAAAQKTHAETTKAQTDAQTALQAAQAAKDQAKIDASTKQVAELTATNALLTASIQSLTATNAALTKLSGGPVALAAGGMTNAFYVAFAPDTRARVLRMWLVDFETDAPAIRKVTLTDAAGKTVLPPAQDVVKLKQNDTLEIVPGDRITVTYEDPRFVTKEKQSIQASLTATFHNAMLSACFIESVVDAQGNRHPNYIPMRRFKVGDTINVFINDPDRDTTDKTDVVKFIAQGPGGKPVELDALETEEHSGIFLGKIFPVAGAPQRPAEVTISAGEDLTLTYRDEENTDPGIPWARTFVVEQTTGVVPDLRVYETTSRPLTEAELKNVPANTDTRHLEEHVPVTRTMIATRPTERAAADKVTAALIGAPLIVELAYPTVAQSPVSKATLYVQTAAGRKKYGKPLQGEFDRNVPGTIKLERFPGDLGIVQPPPGYSEVLVRGNPYAADPIEDGRFTFLVPMKLGEVPEQSLALEKDDAQPDAAGEQAGGRDQDQTEMIFRVPYVDPKGETKWYDQKVKLATLRIRGDDEVFVGFEYQDETGAKKWQVQRVKLGSDVMFDVMDKRYQQSLPAVHVGESLSVRVIHPVRDTSDEKDQLDVTLVAGSGAQLPAKLVETFAHSGIFKGVLPLVLAGDPSKTNEVGSLAVAYGDSVKLTYQPAGGGEALTRTVQIYKGAAGTVLPFTKRFQDPGMAVETQFTVAEAYFEMAKKHRELQQETLARREIGQGKKLLEEAIRDYPNTEVQAQADYLLADLSLEFANDAATPEEKKKHYLEAVLRFSDIVASYPDSAYAPKAQFKKALIFEKMGEMDQACDEYVKLSYRYPDNELVAETIARLGQYFLTKGKEFQDKAAAETNVVENEKIKMQAREMYKTAAQVFGRLAKRFPDHRLAGKTTVLSAQCYMRADDFPLAIEVFKKVVDEKKAEPDMIAQAMYWAGDCHLKRNDPVNAYRLFKKLTWDYPESTWAKYARGRLTEQALSSVETTDTSGSN